MHPFMGTEDARRFEIKLKEGEDIPVLFAAHKGDEKSVIYEIRMNDADIDSTTRSGLTIMHFAAVNKEHGLSIMYRLPRTDFSAKDVDGEEPIHFAVRVENYDFAEYALLFRQPMAKNLLHFFVMQNNLELAKKVYAKFGGINAVNSKRKTFLHYAAQYAGREMCEWLVEKGLDVSAKTTNRGATMVHLTIKNRNSSHCMENIDFFISKNRHLLNESDKFGESPLFWALRNELIPIADFLLEKGANIWARNKKRMNLLLFCVSQGNFECAKFVHSKNNNLIRGLCVGKLTALHLAASNCDLEFCRWLVDNGVDPKALDSRNRTAHNIVGETFLQCENDDSCYALWRFLHKHAK